MKEHLLGGFQVLVMLFGCWQTDKTARPSPGVQDDVR